MRGHYEQYEYIEGTLIVRGHVEGIAIIFRTVRTLWEHILAYTVVKLCQINAI